MHLVHTFIHIYTHLHIYTQIYTYIYIYIHAYIYIYIYRCQFIHTYIYRHIHSSQMTWMYQRCNKMSVQFNKTCLKKKIVPTYMYIYILWRGNMTPSFICQVVGKGAATLWLSADYSSKQELQSSGSERGRLSSTLSIITRWYGQGRTSLSISHVCISGEANLRPWLVLRKKPPKSQHVMNFRTMETS